MPRRLEAMRGTSTHPPATCAPEHWPLRPAFSLRTIVFLLCTIVVLAWSAERTEIHRLVSMSAQAVNALFESDEHSQVGGGVHRIVSEMFPLQFAQVREIERIEGFDRARLPLGAHIETRVSESTSIDPRTLEMRTLKIETEVLVEPYGYLLHVLRLMIETIEIAAWGTLTALALAIPFAVLGARKYAHPVVVAVTRCTTSILRAIPELISALLLVLVFGFGPIAGVLALGLHTAGFLGKFFAEDIENAPRGPQDALRAAGANSAKVLRYAVLPQVLPSYLAYMQYVLERNIRTATVLGVVGAGGIGQELKGRFEMFSFSHVGTVLLVIVLVVLTLEHLTGRLRKKVL